MNMQPPRKRLRFAWRKLVADNMVAIIKRDNQRVEWRRLTHTEHFHHLAQKLNEEIAEVQQAVLHNNPDEIAAEFADVIEVLLAFGALQHLGQGWLINRAFERQHQLSPSELEAIKFATPPIARDTLADALYTVFWMAWVHGINPKILNRKRLDKYARRGGYANGIFIEYVDILADDPWAETFLKDPEKYGYMGEVE